MIPYHFAISLAICLDLLIGDPFNKFHPVVWMGRLARFLESPCRKAFHNAFYGGVLAWILVVGLSVVSAFALSATLGWVHPLLKDLFEIWLMYACLAMKSLWQHIDAVHLPLSMGNLEEARRRVSLVVGRDTAQLNEEEVARAAVESAAENLTDGVIAPLFWAFIAGPYGMLIYKAINTMDSTFGYRNLQYLYFGRCSARMDDIANFLPARLTGILMILSAIGLGLNARLGWRIFLRDRHKHSSPNAGQTEAAAAGLLEVQLGGPSSYGGVKSQKPLLGEPLQKLRPGHIKQVNALNLVAYFLFWISGVSLIGLTGVDPYWF